MKKKRLFITVSVILAFAFILCGCEKANSIKFKNTTVAVCDQLKMEISPDDGGYTKILDNWSDAGQELRKIGVTNENVNEEYFNKYKLLVIVLPPTNSEFKYNIKNIILDGNTLNVSINDITPKTITYTLLLQYKAIFADIPRNEVPDGVEVSFNIEK